MGVGDERHLQGAVSRTERAAGLWSGVEPTTRSGRVRRDLVCICLYWQWLGWSEAGVGGAIPPPVRRTINTTRILSRCPELLREVAPGQAQVSGPVDRVSAFHYRLKVTHGQGLGKDNRPC